MTRRRIVHLVDDTTPGGIMRVIDNIITLPDLAATGTHSLREVDRTAISLGRIRADVIVSHLSIRWRGLPALLALRAANPGARLVHVEHSYTRSFTALNVANRGRFLSLLRIAYSLFDRVVAVSHDQADWLRQRGLVQPEALVTIPSCVDLAPFAAVPPAPALPRVLGAIGRLEPQKGFDILIQAFRRLEAPELRLRIFGEGGERAALQALAQGDDRIRFEGHAPDPVAAFAAVDAVVMPSRWEAFGLVALEARAAGRMVLVAPVDGLRDHIAAGARSVAGPLVSHWTEGLRQATTEPVENSPAAPASSFQRNHDFARAWSNLCAA